MADNRAGGTVTGPRNWGVVLTEHNGVRCDTFRKRLIPKKICMLRQTHARVLEARGEMRCHLRRCLECVRAEAVAVEFETIKEAIMTKCVSCGAEGKTKGRGMCRRCYNRAYSKGALAGTKAAGHSGPTPVVPAAIAVAPVAPVVSPQVSNAGPTLTLDFAGHQEIFDALVARARDELRPIEWQVMFSLRQALAPREENDA